ncbi:uncharacterized protein LOC115050554 [Echeneis naucrates]|uniref:uncharacterized protein LOC115050554 n=1 Tax=Echeneis naucrates TaxID=173247 RepID=UPI001113C6B0|nr:uncharacterized protein LOC115050554 [Echeneis naucrates]
MKATTQNHSGQRQMNQVQSCRDCVSHRRRKALLQRQSKLKNLHTTSKCSIGISTNCCAEIYCGSKPVSVPEAEAVTQFVGKQKDDFLCFLTIHSYSQLLLIPYGHPNFTAPDCDGLIFTVTSVFLNMQTPDTPHYITQQSGLCLFYSLIIIITPCGYIHKENEFSMCQDRAEQEEVVKGKKNPVELPSTENYAKQDYVHSCRRTLTDSKLKTLSTEPNSGSARNWARMQGIPFTYTFELRAKGTFGFLLPVDQIQPACEEADRGALTIITYAHDKTFKNTQTTSPYILKDIRFLFCYVCFMHSEGIKFI